MGLNHEFILVKNLDDKLLNDEKFFINLINKEYRDNTCYVEECLDLDDDVIGHMYNTLRLVKSITPNNPNIKYGINRHGITLFNSESFVLLKNVITECIKNYSFNNVDFNENNVIIDKLMNFNNMILYLEYPDYYIIHLGI